MKLLRLAVWVFVLSLIYATLRYTVFKGTPLDNLPVFVLNKAVSMTALFMLGLSVLSSVNETRRQSGMMGLALSALHVLLSQAILAPGYFQKLYLTRGEAASFSLTGELVVLTGALGLWGLLLLGWPKHPASSPGWRAALPWIAKAVVALVGLHCLFLGWSGWFSPSAWPGYMPPITLICFVFSVLVLLAGLRGTKTSPPEETPGTQRKD